MAQSQSPEAARDHSAEEEPRLAKPDRRLSHLFEGQGQQARGPRSQRKGRGWRRTGFRWRSSFCSV